MQPIAFAFEFRDPENNESIIGNSLSNLSHPNFQTRNQAFSQLKNCGYEAADEILAACQHPNIETRESCQRLLQLLPDYHCLTNSIFPADQCQDLNKLLHGFKRQNFIQKVSRIHQIAKLPDSPATQFAIYCLARFESDEIIRQLAAVHFLEQVLPADRPSVSSMLPFLKPMSTRFPNLDRFYDLPIEEVIPNREPIDSGLHSAASKSQTQTRQEIALWIIGKFNWKLRNKDQHSTPLDQRLDQNTPCYELTEASLPTTMTNQATWIRQALLDSIDSPNEAIASSTANRLDAFLNSQPETPLVDQNPDRYQIKLQCIARLACWNALHARGRKQREQHRPTSEPMDELQEFCDFEKQFLAIARLPEVFLPNSQVICDTAVKLQSRKIFNQLLETYEGNLPANLPTALALSNAAFTLGDSNSATRILQQVVIYQRRPHDVLQYAVLSQELGYRHAQKFLLTHLATIPTNDQTAQVIARLLLAESDAEDCNYQAAANRIERTLIAIDQSNTLATRLKAQMPCQLKEIIGRYYYFWAQEAVSQFQWSAAKKLLTIGQAISPNDTNILTLAFRISEQSDDEHQHVSFDWLDHQSQSILRLHQPSIESLLPTWIAPIPGELFSEVSEFPVFPSDTNMRQQIVTISALNNASIGIAIPTDLIAHSQTMQQLPLLEGNRLRQSIINSLDAFEQQMQQESLVLHRLDPAAARHQAEQQLATLLNRWSFLASHSNGNLHLAYQRSKLATEITPTSAAYFDTLAFCCQRSGRYAEAVDATRSALALQPNNPEFQARLASLESLAISDLR